MGTALAVAGAAVTVIAGTAAPSAAVPATTATTATRADTGQSVFAWGFNNRGELGDGTQTDRDAPVTVTGLAPGCVRQVVASSCGFFSAALLADGTVCTWGSNENGQLGDAGFTDRNAPAPVPGMVGITQLAIGEKHILALSSRGEIWSWGTNDNGQLGDGTIRVRAARGRVPGLAGVRQVAAGCQSSLALRSDGTVWAWGRNSYGQLGDGTFTNRLRPVQVHGLTGIAQIASGWSTSYALRSDGTVVAWGLNEDGELANGCTGNSATPVQVRDLTGVSQIAAGIGHVLAIAGPGRAVWAWGLNTAGQVGDGRTTSRRGPVQIGVTDAAQVSAGDIGSAAVLSDGTLLTWGDNSFGQLGTGTPGAQGSQCVIPVQVTGLAAVSQVALGHRMALAIGQLRPGAPAGQRA